MKYNFKSEKHISLLVKLSGISTFFLLLSIIVFSIISVRSVHSSSMETAVIMGKDKLMGDMVYFEDMIFNEYGQLSLHNGKLTGQDNVSLEYRYELVDKLSSAMGIVATVFVREGNDYRRICTSIVDESGKRANNTFLGTGSAAYSSVHTGNDYSGNAVILGRDYLTHYRPIFASNNRDVIGILFIGIEMTKIGKIISQNTSEYVLQIVVLAIVILLALIIVYTMNLNVILVKPIQSLTAIIRRLSMGDINQQIGESKKRDELGTMKNELKHLIDGLKRTASFAQNIGKGNLNAEYQPLSNNDVLGNSLLEMRQSLQNAEKLQIKQANTEQQRNWIAQGLAQFAVLLRANNDNIENLCQAIISHLVKYVEANQGGIFILNNDNAENPVLEMKACYAYERRKFLEKKIEPGEGLVGTCLLEGQSIYMNDIPRNYINITSGLGDDTPRALLIVPLKVNEEVYGIIEIAAFTEFEPHVREFVEKVSESIASTIGSVKVNIHTNQLLMKSKLQAEEMVNQEEELRQNMEEMQATQEEMLRREIELKNVLNQLQVSEKEFKDKTHWFESMLDSFTAFPVSVTDMDGKVTFLNQAALDMVGMTREEALGKPCSDVFRIENCHTEKCGYKLLKKCICKSTFKIGNQMYASNASYLKDIEGNNIGHIEVISNVTNSINKEFEM